MVSIPHAGGAITRADNEAAVVGSHAGDLVGVDAGGEVCCGDIASRGMRVEYEGAVARAGGEVLIGEGKESLDAVAVLASTKEDNARCAPDGEEGGFVGRGNEVRAEDG